MKLIKPKKLTPGDTIGLISVSGVINNPSSLESAKSYFEKKGYNVIISPNVNANLDYLSGTDAQRQNDIESFFCNPEINAIVCIRGGYGAIRIINKIDYKLIANNPKIFVGYSDITALLAMIYKKTGLITFHGPMALGDFSSEICANTESSFFETLSSSATIEAKGTKAYSHGKAKGVLFGGNLSTIASLCGADFIPDEKFVFFCEDLNEPVYKLDRMFTQLLNLEKFKSNLCAVVFGEFSGVDSLEYLDNLLKRIASELKVPCVGGFKITHAADKITLPFGVQCTLSAENLTLKITDSYLEGS